MEKIDWLMSLEIQERGSVEEGTPFFQWCAWRILLISVASAVSYREGRGSIRPRRKIGIKQTGVDV